MLFLFLMSPYRELYKSFKHYMNYAKAKASNGTKLSNFGLEDFANNLVRSALVPLVRLKFDAYRDVVSFDDIYAKTVYYHVRRNLPARTGPAWIATA